MKKAETTPDASSVIVAAPLPIAIPTNPALPAFRLIASKPANIIELTNQQTTPKNAHKNTRANKKPFSKVYTATGIPTDEAATIDVAELIRAEVHVHRKVDRCCGEGQHDSIPNSPVLPDGAPDAYNEIDLLLLPGILAGFGLQRVAQTRWRHFNPILLDACTYCKERSRNAPVNLSARSVASD